MATGPSKETLLLRGLWLKAHNAVEPLRLPASTPNHALQLRLRFYNAVKTIRNGQEENYALLQAITDCTLRINPDNKKELLVGRRRDLSPEIDILEAALGQTMDELRTPEEEAAEASLQRLMATPPRPTAPPRDYIPGLEAPNSSPDADPPKRNKYY